jgi:hypothetical protein
MLAMPGGNKWRKSDRQWSMLPVVLLFGGFVFVMFAVSRLNWLDVPGLPDWFSGGESDKAPRGSVFYEGQEARSVSEDFLIDVGDGEATVAVKARQEWDTRGGVLSGDFVPGSNGSSTVADPDDRDTPAALVVSVDYCADGTITATGPEDAEAPTTARTVRFDMGDLYVCDTTLEHTRANDAAFRQSDAPPAFHGRFVSFVAGATETTAAAAACPTDELDQFRDADYVAHVREQLADRFGIPLDNVEVVRPGIGTTDQATQRELREQLDSYANAKDPDDPSTTLRALDIEYLTDAASAVEDSCYRDPGATDLDSIDSVGVPDPGDH